MASRSPTSSAVAGPASDMEAPSSPPQYEGKSFLSQAATEDDDNTSRVMMDGASPEPAEKGHGSSGRGGKGSRQNKDGGSTVGKIRHLKKEDGEPLWREDIQYDFLKEVFGNESTVFTNSYEPDRPKQNFADLYIDTMSRSSKTSKVLRDKLLSDRDAAKGMAMVCLLVNIGRMNTTLNFFPEMRAQLRTYHAIPSLQAHQDPHAYKQLQDAPRLKSILKGGAEDRQEPSSINKIKSQNVPRTNPVNLLFVICSAAPKIAELHFPHGQEFHDLVMKTNYSSRSRAMSFLWIMWFYLESDFTEEGCDENPFGRGVDYGVGVANQGVPRVIEMTAEEKEVENVDSIEETEFGREKQKMRAKILEADQQLIENQSKRGSRTTRLLTEDGPAILPRIRPSRNESDMDSVRSTPPPKNLHSGHGGTAKGSGRRGGNPLKYHQVAEGSSPAGSPAAGTGGSASHHHHEKGSGSHSQQVIDGVVTRKMRPPTAHQLAVERNRNQRARHILDRDLRKEHRRARKMRKQEGAVLRAVKRNEALSGGHGDDNGWLDDSDPDEEALGYSPQDPLPGFRERGPGGIARLKSERDDFGEEANAYAAGIRRSVRRLDRWIGFRGTDKGPIAPVKRKRAVRVVGVEDDDAMGDDGYAQDFDADLTMDMDADEYPDVTMDFDVGTPVPAAASSKKRSGAAGKRKKKTKVINVNGKHKVNGSTNGGRGDDLDQDGDVTVDDADDTIVTTAAGRDNSPADEEELDDMERSLLGMAPGEDAEDSGSESN